MDKIEKAIKAGEARAAQFAKSFPVGTPCIYYPTTPFKEIEADDATIRSDPWVLGHGAVVVAITGRTGGVLIDHIVPAPTNT